jgi:hypothetical protein
MRTRRQFRPTFDSLPGRIAPSAMGIATDPIDPSSNPGPTGTIIDPIDPSSNPSGDPGGAPPIIGPGSTTTPNPTGTMLC